AELGARILVIRPLILSHKRVLPVQPVRWHGIWTGTEKEYSTKGRRYGNPTQEASVGCSAGQRGHGVRPGLCPSLWPRLVWSGVLVSPQPVWYPVALL